MVDVAVVVPWRAGCPHREAVWAWIRARYAARHPSWQVVTGTAPPGAWRKATAVAGAVQQVDADVLVVADADVWSDDIEAAVDLLAAGAAWVVPHRVVYRLDEPATARLLAVPTLSPDRTLGLDERPYIGFAGGGIVVLRRATWEQAPLDPRFAGWGHEDAAWARALDTLAGGHQRLSGPLWHLWHPPQDRPRRTLGAPASVRLGQRYRVAASRPTRMQALVEEARRELQEVTSCSNASR